MQPAVKDAHLASSSQQTGLDLTLFLEDVSDSSTHAHLGTKYLTLLFWLQLPLVQM